MRRLGRVLFAAVLLAGTVAADASSQAVDVEKRIEPEAVGSASMPVFRDADKKPVLVTKTKIKTVSSERKFCFKKSGNADKFNPRVIGANKISMQKFNRYAYRKSNSAKPGVPVKKAGDKTPTDQDGK